MRIANTARADLNLIPALAVLLEERHVSRAANRLGLSQPAMSRALGRLRTLFSDPLLIRERDGYRLTVRAQLLHDQLDELLPAFEAMMSPDAFDPSSTTVPINLAGTDFAVLTYGPAICRRLLRESPSAAVRFHGWRYDTMAEQIRRGSVDLGLYGGFTPEDLSSAELLQETFVCVVAADHPSTGNELALDDYLELRHLVIDVTDGVQPDIDYRLRALGTGRTPAVTVPYHAVVPLLLGDSDLVATIPMSLATAWPADHPLRIMAAPDAIRHMSYRMIWHRAYDNDRRHRWLRSTVRAAVSEVSASR